MVVGEMKKLLEQNIIKGCVLGSAMAFTSGMVFAATQGPLSNAPAGNPESQGDILITATVGDLIQVSGLDDILFGTLGAAPYVDTSEFCVYANGTQTYSIQFDSANPNALAHNLIGTAAPNDLIEYDVLYDDDLSPGDGSDEDHGVASATGQVAHNTSTTCGGTENASIQVTLLDVGVNSVAAATPGDYTDTLTITVTAD
jgi:spore coat protein U-like protein